MTTRTPLSARAVRAAADKGVRRAVISALVENQPGVLAHIAGMFAARGFNIDSLVVGRAEEPGLSRMTIVAVGEDRVLEQIRKQLEKVVPVVKVRDFTEVAHVERDLLMVKVQTGADKRGEVVELTNLFRGRVVDVSRTGMMIELSGPEEKIEAFIDLLRPYGILELARTGVISMQRGQQKTAQRDS